MPPPKEEILVVQSNNIMSVSEAGLIQFTLYCPARRSLNSEPGTVMSNAWCGPNRKQSRILFWEMAGDGI